MTGFWPNIHHHTVRAWSTLSYHFVSRQNLNFKVAYIKYLKLMIKLLETIGCCVYGRQFYDFKQQANMYKISFSLPHTQVLVGSRARVQGYHPPPPPPNKPTCYRKVVDSHHSVLIKTRQSVFNTPLAMELDSLKVFSSSRCGKPSVRALAGKIRASCTYSTSINFELQTYVLRSIHVNNICDYVIFTARDYLGLH